jgi:hypothetical protein
MATKDTGEIPVGMRRVCRRFEGWRSGHEARLPIPNALWRTAAEAARKYGVFQAAKALRLDYFELQRHPEKLQQKPSEWMPWNYRETLVRLATPVAA